MLVNGQRHAPAAIYPRGKTPGSHCTGGWVGPRAGLDTEARETFLASAWDRTSILWSSSPLPDTILPELPQLDDNA
jgi:hypothetical protein